MATEFKLPELGENIETGDLVRLMISPGANIAEGQPVMELETDKAVIEVPSSVSGTIGEVRVKEGDKLKVGQVIFTLSNGSGAPAQKKEAAQPAPPAAPKVAAAEPAPAPSAPVAVATPAPAAPTRVERRATPQPQSSSALAASE